MYLFIIGTAGSGKSTLTGSFADWLKERGAESSTVNLDCGAEFLPYIPDFDVREYLRLEDIMADYNLGPNGAQLLASDLLAASADFLFEGMRDVETEYTVVDTPGQLELFILREAGPLYIKNIAKGESMIIFLLDPNLSKNPNEFVSLMFLSSMVRYRTLVPSINVLNKIDLLEKDEMERIDSYVSADFLEKEIEKSRKYSFFSLSIYKVLKEIGIIDKFIPVSSKEDVGFEDLLSEIQNIYRGSSDIEDMR